VVLVLDEKVRELGDELAEALSLSPDRLAEWSKQLRSIPRAQHEELATQLIALAIKVWRALGEPASKTVTQLATLAVELSDRGTVTEAMKAGGFDLETAARSIQANMSKRPVGGPTPKGSKTVLAHRLEGKSKKKRTAPKKGKKTR
jgi:hypothetical protein